MVLFCVSNVNGQAISSASIQSLRHPSKICDGVESRGIAIIKGTCMSLSHLTHLSPTNATKLIVNKYAVTFYMQFLYKAINHVIK